MSWTDERINLLTSLWQEGKTASQIAATLGEGVSRNAVIGKAHRLGLTGRPSPIKNKTEVEEKKQGATILTLNDRMCKWPVGDPRLPGFHFCGKGVYSGFPYCAEHAVKAYQPATRRGSQNAQGQQSGEAGVVNIKTARGKPYAA
ncbi:MAG: GcrA family cell cycle regulator [Alphaproteobacteria bacterium]